MRREIVFQDISWPSILRSGQTPRLVVLNTCVRVPGSALPLSLSLPHSRREFCDGPTAAGVTTSLEPVGPTMARSLGLAFANRSHITSQARLGSLSESFECSLTRVPDTLEGKCSPRPRTQRLLGKSTSRSDLPTGMLAGQTLSTKAQNTIAAMPTFASRGTLWVSHSRAGVVQ